MIQEATHMEDTGCKGTNKLISERGNTQQDDMESFQALIAQGRYVFKRFCWNAL